MLLIMEGISTEIHILGGFPWIDLIDFWYRILTNDNIPKISLAFFSTLSAVNQSDYNIDR